MSAPEDKPGLVKRAVESASDKLSRSRSALAGNTNTPKPRTLSPSSPTSQATPLSSSPPTSASRRLFSLTRKSRHADASPSSSEYPPKRRSTGQVEPDDPFIRPRSPEGASTSHSVSSPHHQARTSRPSLAHSYHPRSQAQHSLENGYGWDGYASMRAGTQTLIQALQAIPWSEDADAEEQDEHLHDLDQPTSPTQPATEIDDDSDDDESNPPPAMFSSIHTIHRPVALSKRSTAASASLGSSEPSTILEDDPEEHDMGDDFEGSSTSPIRPAEQTKSEAALITEGKGKERVADLNAQTRSNPMGTVRVQRRAALAEKLREVFEVPGIEEVIAEMPCWLLRSVMLQGFMYLTNSYLCFFAHLPATEQDQVLKSGFMSKKATRTRRWIKHWFVLKNSTLSWYQSAADPYFPHGVIDLRYALSLDTPPTHPSTILIRTSVKTISLSCATPNNASEWLKALKRATFAAQHSGETVRVALPYSAILDVERSSVLDFSDTLEVKVVDPSVGNEHGHGGTLAVESYFFAYFPDLDRALEMIRSAVRTHRAIAPSGPSSIAGGVGPGGVGEGNTLPVMDTTQQARSPNAQTSNLPASESDKEGHTPPARASTTSMFRLPSLWPRSHPHASTTPSPSAPAKPLSPTHVQEQEDFTHIGTRGPLSFVPLTLTTSPRAMTSTLPSSPGSSAPAVASPKADATEDLESSAHTYPPSPTPSETLRGTSVGGTVGGGGSGWSVGVPSWLRIGRASSTAVSTSTGRQSTIMSDGTGGSGQTHAHTHGGHHEAVYSILETPGVPVDVEMQDKFRSYFALGDEEEVLGYFPGFIYRVIPVPGRLYISTNFFCFKSTGPLSSKTRMIIPLRDVLSTEPAAPWVLNHHGLVVNLRGYEELFFEFSALERRAVFVRLLDSRKDALSRITPSSTLDTGSLARGPLIFDEFEPGSHTHTHESSASPTSSTEMERMFTSQSSTFLRFTPDRPLHFTFLTIGSRGDVQPYIALAKGLQADGHRVRIATHGEFREWIEGQGIEYGYVGGDPAELMKLSVENGMFTVSFLKEGLQKFRGWLDDLLVTSWEACQGTDVLVESPSAMSGYHIAEALQIPYFRAFTMTWTRTRAYPHAFAVPDHKRGGTYNYMSYVLFDQVFWRAIAGQVNRWRRKTLGLGATNLDLMEPHKIPFLYNFSPTIVPPPLDWPDWIRITGYWFLESADVSKETWTPPADVVRFIDDAHANGKKVVYVGFGSIVVSDPKGMTKVIVEAIVQSGVYAILSKGWSDRLQTKGTDTEPEVPLPLQIFSVSSIPHDWLFQRIDAACHHGGAGTTGASLRAGVPTIIKPFFGDQFFWADRVEALGIGSGVRNLTVDALAEALHNATTDAKTIERAKVIGARIRAENGVAGAVQAIYRDLDYARSLIKHKSDHPERAADDATIREATRDVGSGSDRSHSPPPESEWSVIEEGEGVSPSRRSSSRHRPSLSLRRGSSGQKESPGLSKRLVSAMTDVLPSPTKSRKSTV